MTVPHLVLSGAKDYLAHPDGDSLRVFETRVEDAIGHTAPDAKAALIDEIVDQLERDGDAGVDVHVLLDFLDRQRRVATGEL